VANRLKMARRAVDRRVVLRTAAHWVASAKGTLTALRLAPCRVRRVLPVRWTPGRSIPRWG
jgi:hypothetical protein